MRNKEQNALDNYVDPIEQAEMDKFVCMEMSRQIHRYIKAMRGTVSMMHRFEMQLGKLAWKDREEAIARYIDLNRKAISGLDFRMIVARAMANYSDAYDYFIRMIQDEKKFNQYMERVKEKYIQFHEVYEENGKFGIKNHKGDVLIPPLYDFIRTCYVYVNDLRTMPVIAQKDGKMGLILPDGKNTEVAPFIYDDIALCDEPPYFEARLNGKRIFID